MGYLSLHLIGVIFANYVCGLLTPLLALLNIIVFIDLTKSIENNRLAIERTKDSEQELRHLREVEHQKQMLIFQLRIEEVRRFDFVLENAFFSNADEYHGECLVPWLRLYLILSRLYAIR